MIQKIIFFSQYQIEHKKLGRNFDMGVGRRRWSGGRKEKDPKHFVVYGEAARE